MRALPPETLVAQLKWRYATKKFDPARKITDEDWRALEQILVLTPSSYGMQPWRFIVVHDPALREQLLPASYGQRQVVDASHVVVFAIKQQVGEKEIHRHVDRTAEVRGVPAESLAKFKDMLNKTLGSQHHQAKIDHWATNQVYIALGNFMTAAAILGIDTCPMEGINPAKYDEILGLKDTGYATVVACPAGYRAADDKHATNPKVRFKHEDVIVRM
jgi:nitroreductase